VSSGAGWVFISIAPASGIIEMVAVCTLIVNPQQSGIRN
jgi:hypothetical protein